MGMSKTGDGDEGLQKVNVKQKLSNKCVLRSTSCSPWQFASMHTYVVDQLEGCSTRDASIPQRIP